jgi:hypothetical protein
MKNLARTILVGVLLCGLTSTSSARTTPLEAGHATISSQSSCFIYWNGAVFNNSCSGYPIWEVPLVTEGGSSITPYETYATTNIIRPSEYNYTCSTVVAAEPISGYWSSSSACDGAIHGWISDEVGMFGLSNIPSAASVYATFQMPQGTGFFNVRY